MSSCPRVRWAQSHQLTCVCWSFLGPWTAQKVGLLRMLDELVLRMPRFNVQASFLVSLSDVLLPSSTLGAVASAHLCLLEFPWPVDGSKSRLAKNAGRAGAENASVQRASFFSGFAFGCPLALEYAGRSRISSLVFAGVSLARGRLKK